MEGESLESVYPFDYLRCRFTSDGDDAADMHHRMAIAGERSRSLNYLWSDNRLPRSVKLRLYAASVCSTLTHGSEAWILTPRALATLNGFNSRQLHRITGRSYRDEATKPSYDLLTAVRTRRHHWLGHIMRMPTDRLVRRAVLALGQRAGPPYLPGSLLMGTPLTLNELIQRAADRRGWARDGRSLSSLQESPYGVKLQASSYNSTQLNSTVAVGDVPRALCLLCQSTVCHLKECFTGEKTSPLPCYVLIQ